mmetsp:Transcript_8397/g.11052  ORF Transcript_8397/g.11052 Transcript_8397/m.11052 type:complete len:145 (-) Transcript_8397:54-488(-)
MQLEFYKDGAILNDPNKSNGGNKVLLMKKLGKYVVTPAVVVGLSLWGVRLSSTPLSSPSSPIEGENTIIVKNNNLQSSTTTTATPNAIHPLDNYGEEEETTKTKKSSSPTSTKNASQQQLDETWLDKMITYVLKGFGKLFSPTF